MIADKDWHGLNNSSYPQYKLPNIFAFWQRNIVLWRNVTFRDKIN